MPKFLVTRARKDIEAIRRKGDHRDSRKAAWFAIKKGGEVIRDIQLLAPRKTWRSIDQRKVQGALNLRARRILEMRLDSIHALKLAPHHAQGFRMSSHTGAKRPRPVNALCLISGHEGQEIPGLVAHDRVVVDAEHMEQALGPATADEIFRIRKRIGEHVYISTNVSESPQIVRSLKTGEVDTRSTAALTASKIIAAVESGTDVVKVGFANLDPYKRDLRSREVLKQMLLVRKTIDDAVVERLLSWPLNQTGAYPLISVFFPEIGIDSMGERPRTTAEKAIRLTQGGGWQGVLLDTFDKFSGRKYSDFYSLKDTRELAEMAHDAKIEFWIAGSISRAEVASLLKCKVDLICFGGAARHESGKRVSDKPGKPDESIKRRLVVELVRAFEENDPRSVGTWPYDVKGLLRR